MSRSLSGQGTVEPELNGIDREKPDFLQFGTSRLAEDSIGFGNTRRFWSIMYSMDFSSTNLNQITKWSSG
jgi:hypothetical protein